MRVQNFFWHFPLLRYFASSVPDIFARQQQKGLHSFASNITVSPHLKRDEANFFDALSARNARPSDFPFCLTLLDVGGWRETEKDFMRENQNLALALCFLPVFFSGGFVDAF
jgi:hypothetical protein